jgi:hypothetical protein
MRGHLQTFCLIKRGKTVHGLLSRMMLQKKSRIFWQKKVVEHFFDGGIFAAEVVMGTIL